MGLEACYLLTNGNMLRTQLQLDQRRLSSAYTVSDYLHCNMRLLPERKRASGTGKVTTQIAIHQQRASSFSRAIHAETISCDLRVRDLPIIIRSGTTRVMDLTTVADVTDSLAQAGF